MAMTNKIETPEEMLTILIQLIQDMEKEASLADSYKAECLELAAKAEKLAILLRQVARLDNTVAKPLYTRPLSRMLQELKKSVQKAIDLIHKCNRKGMIRRVITITSVHDFKRVSTLLDSSMGDLTWFIAISRNEGEGGGMPPIASSEPLLGYCWNQIMLLYRGNEDDQEEAVNSLNGFAKDTERFMNIMMEEEAVQPLLKVLQEGTPNAREIAARTLGYIARDETTVNQMVACGLAPVFVKVLTNAPMKVQVAVAWAMAQVLDVAMAQVLDVDPEEQDQFLERLQSLFLQHLAVRPLVALLGESLDEPEKEKVPMTMTSLVNKMATLGNDKVLDHDDPPPLPHHVQKPSINAPYARPPPVRPIHTNGIGMTGGKHNNENVKGLTQRELNRRVREAEDPKVKAELKAEVARAISKLAKNNSKSCTSITETKALLCFAALMEKEIGNVQLNSTIAVMEIMAVAEKDVNLRRKAIRMTSPAMKAVVDQLLRLVRDGRPELQVVAIRAVGCLSRTFTVRETRVVGPLVKQLEGTFDDIIAEAVKALTKFACTDNYLHKEHSKAIVQAGGAGPLVQMVFFSKNELQIDAVTLMCYLAIHSGEAATLAKVEPLPALKAFMKNSHLMQPSFADLVQQAINYLALYQGKQLTDLSDP